MHPKKDKELEGKVRALEVNITYSSGKNVNVRGDLFGMPEQSELFRTPAVTQ